MNNKLKSERRIGALQSGSDVFDITHKVSFVVLGDTKVKKKNGDFKIKRKTTMIQVRLTIGGIISGLRTTGISLPNPDDFDRETLTIQGDPINSIRLQTLKNDITKVFNERRMGKRTLNSNLILDIALGSATHDDEAHYIMGKTQDGTKIRDLKLVQRDRVPNAVSAIRNYIGLKEKLLGNGLAPLSVRRYKQHGDILIDFVTETYGSTVFLDQLTPAVEYDLFAFLKGKRKYTHNYAIKIIQFFKSMLTYSHAHRWVDRNVMAAVRLTRHHKEVRILSMKDLELLRNRVFVEDTFNIVRDIFLFCCYTGLAYADVKSLAPEHLIEVDSIDCILKNRDKSGVQSFVPLFPEAITILNRYSNHQICRIKGLILPVLSNQKMNNALKVIGNIVGIKETLHTHIARKTFTMFVEERGFNVDHMAVMLGHTRTAMTEQFYHKKRQEPVVKVFKQLYADGEIKRLAS